MGCRRSAGGATSTRGRNGSLDEEDHRRYGCGKIVDLLGPTMVTEASRLLGFVQYGESSFVILGDFGTCQMGNGCIAGCVTIAKDART